MWFCKINLYCCDLSCFVVSVFGTVSWQIGGCKNSCERERPSSVTRKWSFCFQHLGMVRFSVVASKNIATQCSLCCVFRLTWRLSTPEPGTASCIKAHKPNGGQGKWETAPPSGVCASATFKFPKEAPKHLSCQSWKNLARLV